MHNFIHINKFYVWIINFENQYRVTKKFKHIKFYETSNKLILFIVIFRLKGHYRQDDIIFDDVILMLNNVILLSG